MKVSKPIGYAVALVLGLAIGMFWTPFACWSQISNGGPGLSDLQSLSDVEFEERMDKVRQKWGQEAEEFVRQFRDMTVRIKQFPVDVEASRDGRFAIRLLGDDETMASDLFEKGIDGRKELVRSYSFTCHGTQYSFIVARTFADSNVTLVSYRVNDVNGSRFSYGDTDGDGLWDRFADYTQKPAKHYRRDGLSWKEWTMKSVKPSP